MLGSHHPSILGGLLFLIWGMTGEVSVDSHPATPQERQSPPVQAQRFEDEPAPFIPKTPRTTEDQRRLEALAEFVTARALEEQKQYREALALLEKALGKDPESAPILRSLSRVSFALGQVERGIDYCKRIVETDPKDTATIRLLVTYYRDRKFEPATAEAILKEVLANPQLDKRSAAYFLVHRDLGELYARYLNQPEKAADAFVVVLNGLDDRASNQFTPLEQKLILGDEPEAAYELLGDTFFLVRRYDLSIQAYRRGLAYDPDDVELPLRLSEALLRGGRKAEALATLEPLLKERPEGREPYELLNQILTALDRKAEVIPRLEASLKNDPKNVGLKYVLADCYKTSGQLGKANALYEGLIQAQPDPQGFAALAQSLRKDKKFEELLKLFDTALGVPNGSEAIRPQIEAICLDKEDAGAILDTGLRLIGADPPGVGPRGQNVLVYMANRSEQTDKLIALERLALKRNPTPTGYRELWLALYRANKFPEGIETLQELLAKFPQEADPRTLNMLSQTCLRAGLAEPALEAARKALALNPNDVDAISLSALALTKLGKFAEAIAAYQSLLDRFGDTEEVVKQARSGLSNTYVEMGNLDKGQAELEILYQRDPDDPGVNNDLGYLYADRGQHLEKAEAMIRKALEASPDEGAYLDSLGWVLYRRGKIAEALEPLERAAKIATTDATIFDHLGDVHFRLQNHAKAREAWEKAEALMSQTAPPDKRLPDVRRKLDALKQLPAPATASPDNP